jgi:hypothetical protein
MDEQNQDPKKPLNYWQADPNEEPIQHAPEMTFDEPVAAPTTDEKLTQDDPINWTAQEYIHLEKNGLWFAAFAIIVLGIVALDILLLHTWTISLLVVVIAVAIIIYSRRAPRTLHYAISPAQGLYVGERLYRFDEFKAFGMIRDGEHYSIMLLPVKRFAPGVSVYFPEEAGEKIVDVLGKRLPMENLKLDEIDIVTRWLRL